VSGQRVGEKRMADRVFTESPSDWIVGWSKAQVSWMDDVKACCTGYSSLPTHHRNGREMWRMEG